MVEANKISITLRKKAAGIIGVGALVRVGVGMAADGAGTVKSGIKFGKEH